jgi:hypothetical protein
VADDVHQTDALTLPFRDAEFDRVVVVDMLEHAPTRRASRGAGARHQPGGALIVNTPHLKHTALRRARLALGQTDEKHGHLRPGYDVARLQQLFASGFVLEESRSYTRFFSELVDTAINWGVERLGKQGSAKGLRRHRRRRRAPREALPRVLARVSVGVAVTRLDALVPASGYRLIARFRRT